MSFTSQHTYDGAIKRYKQIIPGFNSHSVITTDKYKIYKLSGAVWTLDLKTQMCSFNGIQMKYILENRTKWWQACYKKKLDILIENYPQSFDFLNI